MYACTNPGSAIMMGERQRDNEPLYREIYLPFIISIPPAGDGVGGPDQRYRAPTQQLWGNQVVRTGSKQIILKALNALLFKYHI